MSAWLVLSALSCLSVAGPLNPAMFGEMKWRSIGPYRGGRTRALAGVPYQPNVFYIGAVNGGVWKTNDYGRTWNPIFDHEPTGSIGAIAVSASDPNIIYVGSGEGLHRPDLSTGDGIYKSTDAGQTWTHLGIRNGQQIGRIAIDPHNPNRLFVAVMGHPYGPNEERGVFRSIDGGKSFQKVLYKDENTGANDVTVDPENPTIVYASLWEARQGPWENSDWEGNGGGVFKSVDDGNTWKELKNGLPNGVIQANLAIAPSQPKRIYAAIASEHKVELYRTDDSGESWSKITDDTRPAKRIGGGDLPVPAVDPQNPDIVYSASIVTWKSTDGGKTWTGIRGAPGGDDYQSIWINPTNGNILLVVSDQGAIVTVNGGQTWSSWYTQPTAQMYHASADNAFPYRVCGGQQESGSACVASRGEDGEITMRDWHPVGAEEYGYAVPDPLDPDLIYGGKLTRYNRRTTQTAPVGPQALPGPGYRVLRTAPITFSPFDPHTLYFASNTLWKTQNGGQSWSKISPDLTRETWDVPETVGKYKSLPTARPTQRGVIYTVAFSPLDAGSIWAGTDDGLIHRTTDSGLHWRDVTPPQLVPFAKVSIIDASHFDRRGAYAAINTLRLDDMRPRIYRTHDGGRNWTEIVHGIPDGAPVNVVREDPKRKGLLFAGTEREIYVSLNDGDDWHPLRLNMPATSVRDLIIKDDDLVAATHGRGFWILDDITPLRQISENASQPVPLLFAPQAAIRVRWDTNTDTPLPPDEPAGNNPPDGAVLDYYLPEQPSGPVALEIVDSSGQLVRKYSSDDPPCGPNLKTLQVPTYWVRPTQQLSADPGMHRFLWDMHYTSIPDKDADLPMQAVYHNTTLANNSPWVMPGTYTVKLTVDGHSYAQRLTVKMDPRVKTPIAGLTEQFNLSKQLYDDIKTSAGALAEIKVLGEASHSDVALNQKLQDLEGRQGERFGGGGRRTTNGPATFTSVRFGLQSLLQGLQDADVTPTSQQKSAAASQHQQLAKLMAQWRQLKSHTERQ